MVRSFSSEPLDRKTLLELLDVSRLAPSAGNSQGVSFLLLDEPKSLEMFWEVSLPLDRRSDFPWPGLLKAPAMVLPVAEPDLYIQRYQEADKSSAAKSSEAKSSEGRESEGRNPQDWNIPYWLIDAAFAVENLLLAVHAQNSAQLPNLGALFFGIFAREAELKAAFKIPAQKQLLGAVAIGHIDEENERPSKSLKRGRRDKAEVIHLNEW